MMSFNVSIINDNIAELDESFTLTLEIPAASMSFGVIAGSFNTATVNITDSLWGFSNCQHHDIHFCVVASLYCQLTDLVKINDKG